MIEVAVLLGNTNSPAGELSPIARSRCAVAARLAHARPDLPLILTGAFGAHFNTSPEPHWRYLAQELARLGVPPDRILAGTASSNTLQDAFATRAAVHARWGAAESFGLHLVTSAFHRPRVRFLFRAAMPSASLWTHAAPDPADNHERAALRRHEAIALRRLRRLPNLAAAAGIPAAT